LRATQALDTEPYYRLTALFTLPQAEGHIAEVKAELDKRFATREEAVAFLERCRKAQFTVGSVSKKPLKRMPAPPFTTSTLQQEAARKLGYTVTQTMMVAQHLYENGRITYMRTDSVNLSKLALAASRDAITQLWGAEYSHTRNFHTHSKGAQEAHEAIRPTYISEQTIEGTVQERRLYDLIWKRTVASQMAESEIEKTVVTIDIDGQEEKFIADGEVVTFDGFLKVYHESTDDENQDNEGGNTLPALSAGDLLERKTITSTEKYSQGPVRYTEASLVKKLEELGIGRPSTYAPTISTIQQREYVVKGDKAGEERQYVTDTLSAGRIVSKTRTEVAGKEKGKLLPTDIGTVVNDFLMEHFPEIMDYNFTAKVESQFDQIAEGHEEWTSMMHNFDHDFEPTVRKVMNARSEHKAGERELGIDPLSHRPVFVKIGRFGPVVQIGSADDEVKPRIAQLPSGKSIETITLDEALELFRLPRNIGEYEGDIVTIGSGRFGPYVQHGGKYVSLPKEMDPMTVTLADAIKLIAEKREQERQRHIKSFEEDSTMQVLNGRFGPYITCDGKNYRLPKSLHERAAQLTYAECKEIVDKAPEPKARRKK
uniref:DNA topoisomerase n=1 Tax=Prevotella sp. TaxID=59823 RepID=UPI004026773D